MIRSLAGTLARLRRDRSGLALIEFAYALPIVLGVGLYSVEIGNLALANMRVSQAALNLADNASRVGTRSNLASVQLREIDINDVMEQVRIQTEPWKLTTRGRVTLSSLENVQQSYDTAPEQRIHWQRCLGLKSGTNWDSSYGTTTPAAGSTPTAANKGTTVPAGGMGPPGGKVTAPPSSGVIFVEINYDYDPVISTLWLPGGSARIQYIASFIVRDRRDFSQIFPSPQVTTGSELTCNRYTT